MRYSHESVRRIRKVLLTRLGYIINARVRFGTSQVDLAKEYGVSISAIRAVKNGDFTAIGFDRLLMVADGMQLNYIISMSSRNGKRDMAVTLDSYAKDELVQTLTLEAGRLSGR